MTIAGVPNTSVDDYLDVIRNKTAVLFAAATSSGAEVAGASPPIIQAAHEYGLQLGMAFQIMDDAMDYSLSSDDMGKRCGDDFLDQKVTLPLIIAYSDGTDDERQFWQRTIGNGAFADGDFEKACAILLRHDAIDRSVAEASYYAHAADSALARITVQNSAHPALLDALSEAAKFAAHRQV